MHKEMHFSTFLVHEDAICYTALAENIKIIKQP